MLALSHKELFFQKSVKPYFVRAKQKNAYLRLESRSHKALLSLAGVPYEVNKSIESGV